MMNKLVLSICLAASLAGPALAQGLPGPFDAGLGVRAMGFGGAYTALAQGSEALLYNPAGLAHLPGPRADSSYSLPMGLYSVAWLAGAIPSLGAGFAYLSAGGITDPQGNPLAYSHIGLVAGVGLPGEKLPFLARFLPFPTALGMSVKYTRIQITDEVGGNLALDLGALTTLSLPFGQLRLGLAIRDLGPGIGLGERQEAQSVDIALGGALTSPQGFLIAVDLAGSYFALGAGWGVPGFELRGGVRSQGGIFQISLGLGVSWQSFALDYALTTHPMLGLSHRLAFGYRFGG
jgi:hypothetical protein